MRFFKITYLTIVAFSIIGCISPNQEKAVERELIKFIYKQRGLDTITIPGVNWTVKERKEYVSSEIGRLKTLKYRDLKITKLEWGGGSTGYWHSFLYFHHRQKNDNIIYYQLEEKIHCTRINNTPCSDSAYAIRVEQHISTNPFTDKLNTFLSESSRGLTTYEKKHLIDFIFEVCLNMKKVVPQNPKWLVEKMAKKFDYIDSLCPCCKTNIKENSAKLFFMSLNEDCSIYKTRKNNGYLQVVIDPSGKYPIKKVKFVNYECTYALLL